MQVNEFYFKVIWNIFDIITKRTSQQANFVFNFFKVLKTTTNSSRKLLRMFMYFSAVIKLHSAFCRDGKCANFFTFTCFKRSSFVLKECTVEYISSINLSSPWRITFKVLRCSTRNARSVNQFFVLKFLIFIFHFQGYHNLFR